MNPTAWEAFRVYLELGPPRRYGAVSRKVGASLRTIRRWARQFDWRGRIHVSTGRQIEQYEEAQSVVQREEILDAAARAQALRDRQYSVAEAMLDAAERYLERVGEGDPDQMSFSDACKALAVAARVGQPAAGPHPNDPSAPVRSLRDQLAVLLDRPTARRRLNLPTLNPQPSARHEADESGRDGALRRPRRVQRRNRPGP